MTDRTALFPQALVFLLPGLSVTKISVPHLYMHVDAEDRHDPVSGDLGLCSPVGLFQSPALTRLTLQLVRVRG